MSLSSSTQLRGLQVPKMGILGGPNLEPYNPHLEPYKSHADDNEILVVGCQKMGGAFLGVPKVIFIIFVGINWGPYSGNYDFVKGLGFRAGATEVIGSLNPKPQNPKPLHPTPWNPLTTCCLHDRSLLP